MTLSRRERPVIVLLWACAAFAILVTFAIVLGLIGETLRFFAQVAPADFLFGLHWSPQVALRTDQVGSSGSFGLVPVLAGTLLITALALIVAGPLGLLCAIYLSAYASPTARARLKPALELLAGIPTVVYGFFAALLIAPVIRDLALALGLEASAQSALAAGLVMGIMILPMMSSLTDDALAAVPRSLSDGGLALGAGRAEVMLFIRLPAARTGLMGAVLMSFSRAIGETMIVVMAAGVTATLTANPLAGVTTVTVQIVMLMVGDQSFDSPKTLAAFALGLALFAITLCLNLAALRYLRVSRHA